ncbi:MAG: FtsQ-type POTRA domain-containing protein [Rhodospirillaceae bacterium]|nr:FtsQ-type POTRA domain-containing protein [Rhodospirillaceae bacterium]
MRRMSDTIIDINDRSNLSSTSRKRSSKTVNNDSRNIKYKKKRRGWFKSLLYKCMILILMITGTIIFCVHSEIIQYIKNTTRNYAIDLSRQIGFRIEEIFVVGRNRTSREQLLTTMGINRNDPILDIDLTAIQQRLEKISGIKSVIIERRLPNEINLLINEYNPIVIWQNRGKYCLVDRDGKVINEKIEEYTDLPLMVGEGASDHTSEVFDLLDTEPTLKQHVKIIQWVSNRRWNITLEYDNGNIDIRLPENNPIAAWHELATLEKEQNIFERKIALIDMRLPDRLILRSRDVIKDKNESHHEKNT